MEKVEKYWSRVVLFLIISALVMIILHLSSQVYDLNEKSSVDTGNEIQNQKSNQKSEQDSIWKNTEFSDN